MAASSEDSDQSTSAINYPNFSNEERITINIFLSTLVYKIKGCGFFLISLWVWCLFFFTHWGSFYALYCLQVFSIFHHFPGFYDSFLFLKAFPLSFQFLAQFLNSIFSYHVCRHWGKGWFEERFALMMVSEICSTSIETLL